MYSISIRYKFHFDLIETFKEKDSPITSDVYRITDQIICDLETTCSNLAKNPSIYIFGKMRQITKASDLTDNEIFAINKIWITMNKKLKTLELQHNKSLHTLYTEDYILFLIAEYALINKHFLISENSTHVLALMQEIVQF